MKALQVCVCLGVLVVLALYSAGVEGSTTERVLSSRALTSNTRRASTKVDLEVAKLKEISDENAARIYQLIKDYQEACNLHNVNTWAEGGTLLGAVRHKGLIPWDDDGDFGMHIGNEGNFNTKVVPALEEAGYEVLKWYYGYKVYPSDGDAIKGKPFKFPFIDLFLVDFDESSNSYYPRTDWYRECSFAKSDLYKHANGKYTLKDYPFGCITIKGAIDPEPYLDECYKKAGDWRKISYKGKDHQTYKGGSTEEVDTSSSEKIGTYKHAPCNGPLDDNISGATSINRT